MKVYKCDVCGEVVNHTIRMYGRILGKKPNFYRVDLCSDCFKGIHMFTEQKIKKQKE